MQSKKGVRLFCFSPPVMILTFIVELCLLLYTVVRYKMSSATRIIIATLLCLAIFQFAEFNVCQDTAGLHEFYSRLGFIVITLLPPLGIHLVHTIAQRGQRYLVWLAYGTSLLFIVTFGLRSSAFQGYVCGGNYAVFQLMDNLGGLFFAYYYFLLIIGIAQCLYYGAGTVTKKVREALNLQIFGYLSFLLPTGIVNAVNPETISAIPSVMCGFAVIYALILTFGILPRIVARK